MSDKILLRIGAMIVAMQLLSSTALAVDTMADWTGQNSNPGNTTFTVVTTGNNYGLISPTSVGGTLQSKINFTGGVDPTVPIADLDKHQVYFSDPTLDSPVTLDFTTPLHMEGTITFNSPTDTEPNLLFGWYSSENTTHRIGLGISNRTTAQGGNVVDALRVDFGYASQIYANPTPPPANLSNKFYYVSTDGNQPNTSLNSVIPNGTYPFTFDYVPGNINAPGGGSISATVGTFFKTVQPLETEPEDNDLFSFDRFGFVQRATGSTTGNPTNTYNITFSNVTYTGGTAAAVAIPGDFDADLDVDATDLGIWSTNFGTGTSVATGDADNDGDADGNDFLIWQQNLSVPPITAVPEPAALTLVSVGVVALWRRRSRS